LHYSLHTAIKIVTLPTNQQVSMALPHTLGAADMAFMRPEQSLCLKPTEQNNQHAMHDTGSPGSGISQAEVCLFATRLFARGLDCQCSFTQAAQKKADYLPPATPRHNAKALHPPVKAPITAVIA
jgi:hypothetical protein